MKLILANKNKIKAQAKKNRKEMGIVDESDLEEEADEENKPSMFELEVDCVELRKAELLAK